MRGKLSWRPKRGGFAWNNGFFLVDVVVACSILLLLIVPIVRLSQQSMTHYAEATRIQQSAMIGREVMERSRGLREKAVGETLYERQGKQYVATVTVTAATAAYVTYIVEVTDETGRIFRCKRLERIRPEA